MSSKPAMRIAIMGIGWLALCAAQSPVKAPKAGPTTAPRATPTATSKPFPGDSTDRCYNTADRDGANLCAQWKAAIAAESSADAAWWTVYFAGLGIALTVITMAAAIAAAYFAKRAADETKRGADAAHGANRPWLDIDLKLHGICVNYDRRGYSLQLEVIPLNAGASPAIDVREHVECVFYDNIPNNDSNPFDFTSRDETLQNRVKDVAAKLREEREAGPTVFPAREQPFYIETFAPWDFDDGYPSAIAWLIVGLRYYFPEGVGESVKVFSVRSFGFPEYAGFECMGSEAFGSTKIDPVIAAWPRYGYVK
jgi:hypothetical protein